MSGFLRLLLNTSIVSLILFGGTAEAQVQPEEAPFSIKELWRYQVRPREITGNQTAISVEPVTDELRVFFAGSNGTCGALFKRTGKVSWIFHAGAPLIQGLHLFRGGPLVVAGVQILYALDPSSGMVRWIHKNPNRLSSPTACSEDSLFVCDESGKLLHLDPASGSVRWEKELSIQAKSTPLITDNKLFLGTDAGEVLCINPSNGNEIWLFDTGGPVRSGFLQEGENLYFGSNDNFVYSVRIADGRLRWRVRTAGNVDGHPVSDGNSLFFAPSDRTLRVYRNSNGHARKGSPIPLTSSLLVRPLLLDELLVFPQKTQLRAITARRLVNAGSFTAPSDITTAVMIDPLEKIIIFGCQNGLIVAAAQKSELDRLETLEQIPVGEEPVISPRIGMTPSEAEESLEFAEEESEPLADETTPPANEKVSTEEQVEVGEAEAIDPVEALNLAESALSEGDFKKASEMWLLALRQEAATTYTIVIGLYCQKASVNNLIELLEGQDIMLFERLREDESCFFVCVGRFGSRDEAERHILTLKEEVIRQGPAIYNLESFFE